MHVTKKIVNCKHIVLFLHWDGRICLEDLLSEKQNYVSSSSMVSFWDKLCQQHFLKKVCVIRNFILIYIYIIDSKYGGFFCCCFCCFFVFFPPFYSEIRGTLLALKAVLGKALNVLDNNGGTSRTFCQNYY